MIKFDNSTLQEIKQRLLVSSVVGRKVKLQSKGRGEFIGLCPFHNEKTPSFTVSDDKEFYYCFGCGAKGNIFQFLMNREGLSFTEAVERLAEEAGVKLQQYTPQERVKEDVRQKRLMRLYQAMQEATIFFKQQLASNVGAHAREYLVKRGFDQSIIDTFNLGYSPPGWHALHEHLAAMGYQDDELLEVGLISKNDRNERYDRFRGRIMFPIGDARQRVVAFGGRALGNDEPKYLNSSETTLFHKGKLLYNFSLARTPAHERDALVVVEGYVDAIALHRVGIKHVVATLGTAVTTDQLMLMWQLSKQPTFCFDGDNAGQRAMQRVAQLVPPLLKPGYSIQFAHLKNGFDPDDVIKHLGVEAMQTALSSAMPLAQYVWKHHVNSLDIKQPEQRAQLDNQLKAITASMMDKTVGNYYQQYFNQQLWQLGVGRKTRYQPAQSSTSSLTRQYSSPQGDLSSIDGCNDMLMLLMLLYPALMEQETLHEQWLTVEYTRESAEELRGALLSLIEMGIQVEEGQLFEKLLEMGHEQEVNYFKSLKNSAMSHIWSEGADIKEVWNYVFQRRYLAVLQQEYKQMLYQMTEEAMRRASLLKLEIEHIERSIQISEIAFGEVNAN